MCRSMSACMWEVSVLLGSLSGVFDLLTQWKDDGRGSGPNSKVCLCYTDEQLGTYIKYTDQFWKTYYAFFKISPR